MGWNDRLPEDPYTPPESFYSDRDAYEAWLDYIEMQLDKEATGLTSQNLDPAALQSQTTQETPARPNIAAAIWARIFGQNIPKNEQQEDQSARHAEDADVPF